MFVKTDIKGLMLDLTSMWFVASIAEFTALTTEIPLNSSINLIMNDLTSMESALRTGIPPSAAIRSRVTVGLSVEATAGGWQFWATAATFP
jgi:hypothetical protein